MNRINLICLGVRDIKKSLAFYKNIGFKTYEKADQPVVVFFDNQGSKLELYPLEELARDIDAENPPPLSQGGFAGMTLACNMKSREEVYVFMKKVQERDRQTATGRFLGRLQRLLPGSGRLLLGGCLWPGLEI